MCELGHCLGRRRLLGHCWQRRMRGNARFGRQVGCALLKRLVLLMDGRRHDVWDDDVLRRRRRPRRLARRHNRRHLGHRWWRRRLLHGRAAALGRRVALFAFKEGALGPRHELRQDDRRRPHGQRRRGATMVAARPAFAAAE